MEDNKTEKNEEGDFVEASVEFTLKLEESVEKASNTSQASSFPDQNSGSDFEKELWDHPSVILFVYIWIGNLSISREKSMTEKSTKLQTSILTFSFGEKNQWLLIKCSAKSKFVAFGLFIAR